MGKAIFITVRTDSSRLPNKALLEIFGKPIIELIIKRAKQAKGFDKIVLCTTEREVDNRIVEIAKENNIECFRGSLEDKLLRWLGAAKQYNLDYFVTMDGDDLFCDPELMELGARQMEEGIYDFIKSPFGLACGAFTYAIRTSALEKVCKIKDTNDTEMMWVYFEDTGLFRVGELNVLDSIYYNDNVRMTLDYQEDFDFFKRVFTAFNCINNEIPLRELMRFFLKNPEITSINLSRQKDFIDNQKRKTKLLIKEIT